MKNTKKFIAGSVFGSMLLCTSAIADCGTGVKSYSIYNNTKSELDVTGYKDGKSKGMWCDGKCYNLAKNATQYICVATDDSEVSGYFKYSYAVGDQYKTGIYVDQKGVAPYKQTTNFYIEKCNEGYGDVKLCINAKSD